jgi:diketogulonate reductase-like aldo/keto reductase
VDALTYAVELGLNVIDTAEMYQNGGAEEIVGLVIRRVGRERVFITTKLLPEIRRQERSYKGCQGKP